MSAIDPRLAGPAAGPELPGVAAVRRVPEEEGPGPPPHLRHPEWQRDFPWLIQGVTTRSPNGDFRLEGGGSVGETVGRWEALREALGAAVLVGARQPHGVVVRAHRGGAHGVFFASPCDGHLTADPGVALAVTVADCVPVFLLAPGAGAVALLHAGWRGMAAGIVEAGIAALRDRLGVGTEALLVHLGPAISGDEYEVGPEVHVALGLPAPPGPRRVDLRAVGAWRAGQAGVPPERVTMSPRCTVRDPLLLSHRGGDEGRMIAFVGIRR